MCCSQCFSREIRQNTSPVCLVCESDEDEGGGLGGAAAAAAASDGLPKKKKYVPREAGDIPAFTPAPSSIRAPLLKDPRLLVVEPQRAKIPIDEGASDHYGRVMRAEYSEPSRDYVEEAQKDKAVTTALRRLMESAGALQPPPSTSAPDFSEGRLAAALLDLKTANESGRLASPGSLRLLIEALPPIYTKALQSALRDRNKKNTDYNPTLTALRGCNTAIYLLSGEAAAKAALFYIMEYMTKNPTELSCTVSLALAAKSNIDAHPSKADDTGTEKRTAQHFLNRLMNTKRGKEEVSMMLASSCLIGLSPEPMTHNSAPLNVGAAITTAKALASEANLRHLMEPSRQFEEHPGSDEDDRSDDNEAHSDDVEAHSDDGEGDLEAITRGPRIRRNASHGAIKPDFVDGAPVLPSILTAYTHRPDDFVEYSLYMFFCVCEVALRKPDSPVAAAGASLSRGREANKVYEMKDCDLSSSHVIKVSACYISPTALLLFCWFSLGRLPNARPC